MRQRTRLVLAAGLVVLLLLPALAWAAHDKPAWLTEVFEGPKYDLHYTSDCPSGEADCLDDNDGDGVPDEEVPDTDSDGNDVPDIVDQVSGYVEASHTEFVDTFGMEQPRFNDTSDRPAYMTGGCWGQYNGHRIRMCPSSNLTADWVQAKATVVHELFHAVQRAYGGGQPAWITEGQASLVEDAVFDDLDGNAGTFLYSRGEAYLADPNRRALTGTSYAAVWFWKYFAEQYGTLGNPGQGMDAVETFWDEARSSGTSGIPAVDRGLNRLSPGTTFEDVYKDFVVANYARKLPDSGIPSKYRFADEDEPAPGPLRAVRLEVDRSLGADEQVGPLPTDARAWGARYYEVRPGADVPLISFEVKQDTPARTSSNLFYVLLGIKGGDIVLEERTVAVNYSKALANDAYDRVVLIVAGLEHYANYRLSINGSDPVLNVVDPLGADGGRGPVRPAFVGDPDDPEKFLLKVEVLDPDGDPIVGLDPSTFSVTVGSEVVPNERILTPVYVQGQYWMLVRAPTQDSAGRYALRVEWSSLSDVEQQAIAYSRRPDADNIVVVDRSSSMADFDKLRAAKNAGRLYVDSWRDGEKLGVVRFNHDAQAIFDLTDLDDTARRAAKDQIDDLTASGATAIGDGLLKALEQFDTLGDTADKWAVVVLSDGMETDDRRIADFLSEYKDRTDNGDKVPEVHTVALGADADRGALQDLAEKAGGSYQYAAEPASTSTAATTAAAVNLPLDLAEIYRIAGEEVADQQQIFNERVTLGVNPPQATIDIPVDAGASEAIFTLNWEDNKNGAAVTLTRPDGSTAPPPDYTDATHYVWRVSSPQRGTWQLHLDCLEVSSCAMTYLAEVALKSPVTFDLFFDPAPAERIKGMPVVILAPLTDHAAILGADVDAEVTLPDGSVDRITLYDDGTHHDGAADDGLYGNRFFRTFQDGSYVVHATALGTSNLDEPFRRHATHAFDLAPDRDSDGDGIVDTWEEEQGTDPNMPDGQQDSDLDGLINIDEYLNGTDPHDPDSDNGGESDGSEMQSNQDPLDPTDDGAPESSGEIYVTPWDSLNIITFPVVPQVYDHLILYRSTNPDQGYQVLDAQVPPTGVYSDTRVSNGTTYWYRLAIVGPGGARTPPTDARSGTPRADPVPPGGFVLIDEGAETTQSRSVRLTIGGRDDEPAHVPSPEPPVEQSDAPPAEMRISNDPTFTDANWEPFARSRIWQLDTCEGPAVVYVEFRDEAGNISRTAANDAITVEACRTILPIVLR